MALGADIITILWNVFFIVFAFGLIFFDTENFDCFSSGPCRYKEEFAASTASDELRNLTRVSNWKLALGYSLISSVLLGPVLTGTFFGMGQLVVVAVFTALVSYFMLGWWNFHFLNPSIERIITEYSI